MLSSQQSTIALGSSGSGRGDVDDRKRIAAIIRDYLARERMSREQLAFKAKLGKSTVDKLLIGLFSDKTLSIVEGYTGLSLRSSPPREQPAALRAVLASPDTPSIAVLPFTNMSGDLEQEYFADGITEDITTALSRLRWLFVIARNSTFTYKGRAVDVRQVASELAVRYVLEGSVRTSGRQIRVTGQLVDAATGNQIWALRYDRALAVIFALQDEITANVVATIEPQLYAAEDYRAKQKPPESLDAWGCVARGLSL